MKYRNVAGAALIIGATTIAAASPAAAATPTGMQFVGNKPISITALDAAGRSATVTAKVICPEGATGFIRANVAQAYDGGLLGKYLTFVRCTGDVQKLTVRVDVPNYGPNYPYTQQMVTPGETLPYGVSIPLFRSMTSPFSGEHLGTLTHTGETKIKRPE